MAEIRYFLSDTPPHIGPLGIAPFLAYSTGTRPADLSQVYYVCSANKHQVTQTRRGWYARPDFPQINWYSRLESGDVPVY